jgi:hypothetical protein
MKGKIRNSVHPKLMILGIKLFVHLDCPLTRDSYEREYTTSVDAFQLLESSNQAVQPGWWLRKN